MSDFATEYSRVQTNINNTYTAIGNKGGTVPSNKTSANLQAAVNSIPTITDAATGTSVTGIAFDSTITKGDFIINDMNVELGDETTISTESYSGYTACLATGTTKAVIFHRKNNNTYSISATPLTINSNSLSFSKGTTTQCIYERSNTIAMGVGLSDTAFIVWDGSEGCLFNGTSTVTSLTGTR